MYYLRVKEQEDGVYTDGVFTYSLHETTIQIENANSSDVCVATTIQQALSYFGLKKIDDMEGNVFNSEKAINKMMSLLGIRAYDLGAFHFMICDSIRKQAFEVLKLNLSNLLQLGKIQQSDYDAVKKALNEQNIEL